MRQRSTPCCPPRTPPTSPYTPPPQQYMPEASLEVPANFDGSCCLLNTPYCTPVYCL